MIPVRDNIKGGTWFTNDAEAAARLRAIDAEYRETLAHIAAKQIPVAAKAALIADARAERISQCLRAVMGVSSS